MIVNATKMTMKAKKRLQTWSSRPSKMRKNLIIQLPDFHIINFLKTFVMFLKKLEKVIKKNTNQKTEIIFLKHENKNMKLKIDNFENESISFIEKNEETE